MRPSKAKKAPFNPVIVKYVSQPGDTIYSLARRFRTTPEKIAEMNRMHLPSLIFPGEVILLEEKM